MRKKRNWKRALTLILAASMLIGQVPANEFVKAETGKTAKATSNKEDAANEFAKALSEEPSNSIQTASPTSTPVQTSEPALASYQNQYVQVENGVLHCLPEANFDGASAEDVIPDAERDGIKEVYLDNVDGKSLPKKVFANLKNLNAAHIATGMSEGMFEGSGIEEYYRTIGFSVYFETGFDGNIPKDAFKNCNNLWKVEEVGSAKIVNVGAHAFQNALSPRWERKADGYEREASQFDFENIESASDGAFEGAFRSVSNTSISFNKLKKAYLNTFKDAFYAANGCTISFDAIENFGDTNAYTAYADAANASGYNDIGGVFENAFRKTENVNISFSSLTKLYDNASDGKYDGSTKLAENKFSLFKGVLKGWEEQDLWGLNDSAYSYHTNNLVCVNNSISTNFSFPKLTDTSLSFGSSTTSSEKIQMQKSQFEDFGKFAKGCSIDAPELVTVSNYNFYKLFKGGDSCSFTADKLVNITDYCFYEMFSNQEFDYTASDTLRLKNGEVVYGRSDPILKGVWIRGNSKNTIKWLNFGNNKISVSSARKVGESAFEGAYYCLQYMPRLQSIGVRGFADNDSRLFTKQSIDLTETTSIGNYAFRNDYLNDDVFSSITDNVTSFGNYVFEGTHVDNVDFSSNEFLLVRNGTFKDSTIKTFIPNTNTTEIGEEVFMNCKNLKEFTVWKKLERIGAKAFKESGVSNLNLDDSNGLVFNRECFYNTPVENIVVNHVGGNYIFNEGSFGKTYNLQTVDFSAWSQGGLTISGAFEGSSLKSFKGIQNNQGSVTFTPNSFKDCTELKTVQSYMAILGGPSIFENCYKLESLDLTTGITNNNIINTLWDKVFYNCKSLKSIDLTGIKTLKDNVFTRCESLESVDLSTVTTVGKECFYKCKKAKFTGTNNITSAGAGSFSKCAKVADYDFSALTSASVYGIFEDTIDFNGYVLVSGANFGADYAKPSTEGKKSDIFKKIAIVFNTTKNNVPSSIQKTCQNNKNGYYFSKDTYVVGISAENKDSSEDCNTEEGIKKHIKVTLTMLDGSEVELNDSDYSISDIGYDGVNKTLEGKVTYNVKSDFDSTSNLRGYGEGVYRVMTTSFKVNSSGIIKEVTDISLSPEQCTLSVDERQKVDATITPSDSMFKNSVFWTSSDSSIARVGQNGTVVGVNPGQATIYCYYRRNMEICGSMNVTVFQNKDTQDRFTDSEGNNLDLKPEGIIVSSLTGKTSTKPDSCNNISYPYYFKLGLMIPSGSDYIPVNSTNLEYIVKFNEGTKVIQGLKYKKEGAYLVFSCDSLDNIPSSITVTMWNKETMQGAENCIVINKNSDVEITPVKYISNTQGVLATLNRNVASKSVWFTRATSNNNEAGLPEVTYDNGKFYYDYAEVETPCYDFALNCVIDGKTINQEINLVNVLADIETASVETCDLYERKSEDTIVIKKVISDYDTFSDVAKAYKDDSDKCKALVESGQIKKLVFEEGTTCIPSYFLENLDYNRKVEFDSVTIPETVTELKPCAFYRTNTKKFICKTDKITVLPERCFYDCNIRDMDLSILDGKIKEIGDYCFAYINEEIKDNSNITLPKFNNVEKIAKYSFCHSYLGNTEIDFSNNLNLTDMYEIQGSGEAAFLRDCSVGKLSFKNCSNLTRLGAISYNCIGEVDLDGTKIKCMGNLERHAFKEKDFVGLMINYSYIHKLILPKTIRLMLYESFRGSQIEDIVNEEYTKYAFKCFGNNDSTIQGWGASGSKYDGKKFEPVNKEWDFSGLVSVPTKIIVNGFSPLGKDTKFVFPKTWEEYPYYDDSAYMSYYSYLYGDEIQEQLGTIDFGTTEKLEYANYGDCFLDNLQWLTDNMFNSIEDGTFPTAVRTVRGPGGLDSNFEISAANEPYRRVSFIGADTAKYKDFCERILNNAKSNSNTSVMPLMYLNSEYIDKVEITFNDKLGLTKPNKYSSKDFSNITLDDIKSCIEVKATFRDGSTGILDEDDYELQDLQYDKDLLSVKAKVRVYNLPKKYMYPNYEGFKLGDTSATTYIYTRDNSNPNILHGNNGYSNLCYDEEFTLNNVELSDYIYAVNGLKLDKNKVSVVGASDESNNFKLNATLSPKRVDVDKVLWSSSNENVATVDDNGNVTIHDDGEAELTAMSLDGGYFDTCELTVEEKITGMNIVGDDSIRVGNQSSYTANISSTGNLDKSVTWSLSGNTSKDTKVSADGVVTVGTDEAAPVITLKAVSNFDNSWSAQKPIIVTQFVDSVTVRGDKHVACGTEKTYTATVTGSDYVNKNVTWKISGNTSEDTTIDENGKLVMAINENAAKITVTATSLFDAAKSGSLDVIPERISNITVTGEDTVYPGRSYSYQATVTTTNDDVVTQKDVVWSITGNEDASTQITQDGVLTIGAEEGTEGLFLVAQSVANPEIKGTKNVDVEQFITGITIQGDDSISPAESKEYTADVDGSAKVDKSVTWTVERNRSEDTTVTNGTLICGSDETSDVITLKATSDFDPDITASKEITVTTTTPDPTPVPTIAPTMGPTVAPTIVPTVAPTKAPMPTNTPVETKTPVGTTTPAPTAAPTIIPTMIPTPKPMNDDGKDVTQTPAPAQTPKPSLETLFGTDKDPDKIPGTVELKIPTVVMKKNMGVRKKFQIKLLNAKGATVQVSSSNKKVATINKKGLVTTKKPGKTKVIINMTKGAFRMQYIVNIKVKKKVPFNYSLIKYNTKHKNVSVCLYKLLRKGKSYKITMKHLAKKDKVAFSSSNSKVISVDKKGKCTSHKSGKAIITIKMTKGKRVFTYFMVVRATEKGIESNTSYLKVIK